MAPLNIFFRCALAVAGALILPQPVAAQPTDTSVKAAFLPRFARYVTWPPAAMPKGSDPFVLCVLGSDPFGSMLDDAARSQIVDGRRITVRRLDSAAGAGGCQIAFVEGSDVHPASQMLDALRAMPILTVTDDPGARRGIIQFTLVDGHVRFFIDLASATKRGIQISSRLLALAVGVRQ